MKMAFLIFGSITIKGISNTNNADLLIWLDYFQKKCLEIWIEPKFVS